MLGPFLTVIAPPFNVTGTGTLGTTPSGLFLPMFFQPAWVRNIGGTPQVVTGNVTVLPIF